MVDIAILAQVWLYYENTAKRKKTQMNMHFWQEDDDQDQLEQLVSCCADSDYAPDDDDSDVTTEIFQQA